MTLIVIIVVALGASVAPMAQAQTGEPVAAQPEAPKKDKCKAKKLKEVEKTKNGKYCTHGADPAPAGYAIDQPVPPIAPASVAATPQALCSGDGSSGPRVQVIYARSSNVPDRYNTYLASFRQWVALADRIYQESAAETGGRRSIRFVHDAGCNPTIANVTMSPTGDDSFGDTINELQAQGYNRGDRKYMIFVDALVYCGIGGIYGDDQPGASNSNNFGPSYGRTDAGCWAADVLAHELMHNLGGVQLSAPNSSGGYHCTDEYDVECYSDSPDYPVMQIRCSDPVRDTTRLDCNHDDYYHTNPPAGSYLATRWNTANNQYLDGGVAPPPCPDAGSEPDNTAAEARGVAVDSTQSRAFCVASDQDWIFFQGIAGTSYRLETLNLTPDTDTILDLYEANGSALIATNDDSNGTWASQIDMTAATTGRYYVRATQFGGNGSTGLHYDLRISQSNPVPTTSSIAPTSIGAGGPGFTLTVNGSGFVQGSQVRWNGASRTTSFVSVSQLTASIPAGDIAASGTASISVFNPAPGGGLSNAQTLTITGGGGGGERLLNPGFELDTSPADGKPDSWSTHTRWARSGAANGIAPRGGSAMGRFSATDNKSGTTNQTVTNLAGGATYAISCWVNIPPQADSSFSLKLQVKWRNGSNSVLRTDTITSLTAHTSSQWREAVKSPAPVAPTGTVSAQLVLTASSLNGSIYVDDCSFQ